ncbi:hypothetical protein EA767_09140 [Acinetobacter pittii]|nr:hypothetical protein EA767_09140 [Acinetobacter pittii]
MIAVRLFQALARYYLKLRQLNLEMCCAQSLWLCYAFFLPKGSGFYISFIYNNNFITVKIC